MDEKEKVACLGVDGRYLVVSQDGRSKVFNSKKELKDYLVKNNYTTSYLND